MSVTEAAEEQGQYFAKQPTLFAENGRGKFGFCDTRRQRSGLYVRD